ncbi:TonB-dependent receptor [Ferrimonas pelagia]|uniref:TonB-dependent receptor n=1 Tax=Ferrimonas pelagia TaxID=1177826 RepID=A0ABP9EJG4_9GAMM
MNSKKMFKPSQLALATAFALGLAGQAAASETASSMRGAIVGPNGQAVSDATITIIHQPTGTVTELDANDNGIFNARGLRVGGPYAVVISSDTFQDEYQEGLYIGVGEALRLNTQLKTNDGVERIVVSGSSLPFRTAGSNSEFGEDDIASAPGTNRDLKDVLRQNPMANVSSDGSRMSVAGINPKFNSFVVDGVGQNDDFGLASNGYPTQRSPISIDAVESVALNTSPMSARYGGFSGAQVNAVTKSGTNELSGTMFYEYAGDNLAGKPEQTNGNRSAQDFEESTFGGTIGLPLIKDRLFFFGSYERFDSPRDNYYGASDDPNFDRDSGVNSEQLERVIAAAAGYGLNDLGDYARQQNSKDEKILAKLDWNINDDHRASYTYQRTDGQSTSGTSTSSSFRFASHWFETRQKLETHAFNLYSDWTHNLSTDLKVAYKDQRNEHNPVHDLGIGSVEITTVGDDGQNKSIIFGTERSRHANELDNQNLEIRFVADYQLGDHALAFGVQHNRLDIFNQFAQDALGRFRFDSIENFENGQLDRFDWKGTRSGDIDDAGASFDMNTTALFVENTWDVTYDLELTFGLRYERIGMSDTPELNENFVKRYAGETHHGVYVSENIGNTTTFDGQDIWLPRFGAKYQLTDDIALRGGVGRFAGGYPNVWMSNSFSNDGHTLLTGSGWRSDAWGDWDGQFTLPDEHWGELPEGSEGFVNAIDENFKLASDWRFNLGFDANLDLGLLGDNWYFGGEYLYIKRENDIKYVDLARKAVERDGEHAADFTGRKLYQNYDYLTEEVCSASYGCRYDLMLTNADEDGYSEVLSLALSKQFDNGLRFSAAYAHQNVKEGNQGSSSTANSNYEFAWSDYDRHSTALGTSPYEQKHRVTMTLGYDAELLAGYNSSFNFFYEATSGDNYSYTMRGCGMDCGSLNADAAWNDGNVLAYIASQADIDAGRVILDGMTQDQYFAAVNGAGLTHGAYAPKGAGNLDWNHRLDFRFLQQLPGFTANHRAEMYFDISNVLNLLNSDWGQQQYSQYGSKRLMDYSYDAVNDTYTYSSLNTGDAGTVSQRASAWEMKLGVRYRF